MAEEIPHNYVVWKRGCDVWRLVTEENPHMWHRDEAVAYDVIVPVGSLTCRVETRL